MAKPFFLPLGILFSIILAATGWYAFQRSPISGTIPENRMQTGSVSPGSVSSPADTVTDTGIVSGNPETGVPKDGAISLTVISPANGTEQTTSRLTVRGKTVPSADVFVNEAEVKSDSQGYFSVSLTLEEGDNPILISAIDADGNSAETELLVSYLTE